MAESEEELKSLLMKVESEKVGLKLNIQKMKIMASGPITSRQIDVETVSDFIFWGSKITADGDCRGWVVWMASLTQWTWVWVDSRRWWWTGRPGMLWFMGSQKVGHDCVTELNWKGISIFCFCKTVLLTPSSIVYTHVYLCVCLCPVLLRTHSLPDHYLLQTSCCKSELRTPRIICRVSWTYCYYTWGTNIFPLWKILVATPDSSTT